MRIHGKKAYYQILLDVDKAQAVEDQAAANNQRPTNLMRQWIYQQLNNDTPNQD